jgi:RimJ/RimL family protein N-acetyltransferase
MFFETDRLVFRKPIKQDFMRFWQMLNDPIAKKYTGGVTKLSYQQRLALFEQECFEDFSPQGAEFAVIEKESGNYLGYCGFRYSDSMCGCEFLFGYCRDCWGKGYATESAQAVLDFLFKTYDHNLYIATVDPQNTASKRVLEKVGFVRNGDFPISETEVDEKFQLQKCNFMSR